MTYAEFEEEWRSDSPTVHAHTSGSTGTPKDVCLLKADMEASARATNAFFGVNADSVLLIPLSCDYIAGKMMAVRSYVAGCRLVVIEPKNDFEIGELDTLSQGASVPSPLESSISIESYAEASPLESSISFENDVVASSERRCWGEKPTATLLSIVPSQADALIAHPEWAQRIGAVIIGGAPISFEKRLALVRAGYRAYCSYGMTETCSHVALSEVTGQDDLIFKAMPGIGFGVDDRGCLVVDVPMMSVRQVVTNDIVELIDGHSFRWLGRADNVINSGGIKIFPEALEKEISRFLPLDFYIVGIPDEKWGQAVQIVIEWPDDSRRLSKIFDGSCEISKDIENSRGLSNIVEGSQPQGEVVLAQAIKSWLKKHIDCKFVPKSVHFVQNLPRTDNGKLRRITYNQ